MIILNSPEAIQSLFIQRANIYSGRPVPYLTQTLITPGSEHALILQNDARLKRTRTSIRLLASPAGLKDTLPMQDRIASKLVLHLRENKYNATTCIGLWSFETALTATMGPVGAERAQIDIYQRCMLRVHQALDMLESVESMLYEVVPAIRYLPASPGKSLAKALEKSALDFYKDCLTSLKRHMSQAEESGENVAYWGLIATILRNQGTEEASTNMATEVKPDIRWTESALLGLAQATTDAATDTTISTALSFILALAVNQDILHKAQAEIDQMCEEGQRTEPEYSDISKLPYLKACIFEVGFGDSLSPMLAPD